MDSMQDFTCSDYLCISSFVVIAIINILILPFIVSMTWRYYRQRRNPGINTRYPWIVITQSAFIFFDIVIRNQYLLITSNIVRIEISSLTVQSILYAIHTSFLFVIPGITLYRLYLTRNDIQYALEESHRNWQKFLLSDSPETSRDWQRQKITVTRWKYFIRNISLFWLCALCVLLSIAVPLSTSVDELESLAHPTLHVYLQHVFVLGVWLCLMLPMFVIYKRIPPFKDTFVKQKELAILCKFDASIYVLYASCICLYWIDARYQPLLSLIHIVLIVALDTFQIYICHYWTFRQLDAILHDYRSSNNHRARSASQVTTTTNPATRCCLCCHAFIETDDLLHAPDDAATNNHLPRRARSKSVEHRVMTNKRIFNVLIADNTGINYLAEHLLSEFSSENMLFLIEVVQWIYAVTGRAFRLYDTSPLGLIQFEFASIVPLSSINSNHGDDWYQKLQKLYHKYIDERSPHQVNLSFRIRTSFRTLLHLYSIKREMDAGTYQPKMVRKTHVRQPSLWSRSKKWTLRANTTRAAKAPALTAKPIVGQRSHTEREEAVVSIDLRIPMTSLQQQTCRSEDNILVPSSSNKNPVMLSSSSSSHKKTVTATTTTTTQMNPIQVNLHPPELMIKPHASEGDESPHDTVHTMLQHKSSSLRKKVAALSAIKFQKSKSSNKQDKSKGTHKKAGKSWSRPGMQPRMRSMHESMEVESVSDGQDVHTPVPQSGGGGGATRVAGNDALDNDDGGDEAVDAEDLMRMESLAQQKSVTGTVVHHPANKDEVLDVCSFDVTQLAASDPSEMMMYDSGPDSGGDDETDEQIKTKPSVFESELLHGESNLVVIDEDNEVKTPEAAANQKAADALMFKMSSQLSKSDVTGSSSSGSSHSLRATESEMNSILRNVMQDVSEQERLEQQEEEAEMQLRTEIVIDRALSPDTFVPRKGTDIYRKETETTNLEVVTTSTHTADDLLPSSTLSPRSLLKMSKMVSGSQRPSGSFLGSKLKTHFPRLSGLLGSSPQQSDESQRHTGAESLGYDANESTFMEDEDIDPQEKETMQMAQTVTLNDFVSITCQAIYSVLQLNYQSVARFKQTNEWVMFTKAVDINALMAKHGDNGCVPKRIQENGYEQHNCDAIHN